MSTCLHVSSAVILIGVALFTTICGTWTPSWIVSIGAGTNWPLASTEAKAKLPSGVRSPAANLNSLLVPLKSFDCFAATAHVAFWQPVGSATETVNETLSPGRSASPLLAARNSTMLLAPSPHSTPPDPVHTLQ